MILLNRIRSLFDPELINPIIVKEVRQGNRSRAFLLNFLLAHAAMLFLVILMVSEATSYSGGMNALRGMNQMFWTLFAVFLIIGVPLSGINAINQERNEARLDLLHLTRLSALKIVRGKWLALVSQALLISISLVPYIVVRYYFGSVNIVDDLMVVGIMLLASTFITGLAVCLSAVPSALVRWLLVGLSIWILGIVGIELIEDAFRRGGGVFISGVGIDWQWVLAIFVIQALLVLAMAMEFGASAICPPAENHQSRIRFIFILQLLLLLGTVLMDDEELFFICFVINAMTGTAVVISALIQAPVALPSIYTPFVRFGKPGKAFGFFLLYPGYPSGFYFLVFSVLSMAVCMLLQFHDEELALPVIGLLVPSLLGCFLLPLCLALIFSRTGMSLLGRYILFAAILFALGLASMALSHTFGIFVSYLFIFDPFANIFMMMRFEDITLNVYAYAIGSSAVTGFSVYYIFKQGVNWRRRERELEAAAERLIELRKVKSS